MTAYDPNTHPAVQAAYAAYLDAWVDVANLPGLSERSAADADAAHEVEYRLYLADKAHHDAWYAAIREAHPGVDLADSGAGQMTPGDWRDKYPLLDFGCEPAPHDPGPAHDPKATRDDPDLTGPDTEPEAGS